MFLRAVSESRVGGIIIPFDVKDKFGTYWNRATDFAFDLFAGNRPVFWFHLLKKEAWGRAGTVDDSSLELRDEGVYAEADIGVGKHDDLRVAALFMASVRAGAAAWSTGSMPHLIVEADDGFIERWPIVELSAAPIDQVISLPGTTTVEMLRAVVGGVPEDLSGLLKRSTWIMEPENASEGGGDDPVVPAALLAAQKKTEDALQKILDQQETMAGELAVLRAAPPKQLPDKREGMLPDIKVSSRWDGLSAFEMAFAYEYARACGGAKPWADEKFMRALAHGVEAEVKEDAKGVRHMRAIDDGVRDVWGRRIPHLRADEVMQSTLANYGDELVPTLFSSTAWQSFVMETQVLKNLTIFEMPSNPFEWPTVGVPAVRLVNEIANLAQLTPTASNVEDVKLPTNKVTFTCPAGWGAFIAYSETLVETAQYDVVKLLAQQFMLAMAKAADEVVVSGDEAATATNISHYGTDPTATDYNKILVMDGLRKVAMGASDSVAHATISKTSLVTICKLMGARGILGINPRHLFAIVDPGVYFKMLELDAYESIADVSAEFAVLLTGMIGALRGIPLVVCDELENTEANGRILDSHNSAGGSFLTVNRRSTAFGRLRDVKMQSAWVPGTTGYIIQVTAMGDIQSLDVGSVAYGFNTTI